MPFDAELTTNTKPGLDFKAFLKLDPASFEFTPVTPPPRSHPYSFAPEPEPYDLYLLKRARDRIAQGWTQKMMHDARTDGVCAVGALLCAVQGSRLPIPHRESEEPVVERLASIVYGTASALMGFNDTLGMTKERVLELFDHAIRRLEMRAEQRMRLDRYRYDPNYSRHQYLDSVAMV